MNESVEKIVEKLPYRKCYILSSADHTVRFNGSSGGFVTEFTKYMFREKRINSAICFNYSGKHLFKPTIVFSEKEYVQTGSIYHHVSLTRFLRESISIIQSPLLVTCLPCQCRSIRGLLQKSMIEPIIISLVCSGQLTKQATYDFLSKHKIEIDQVQSLCYRGRGWPSGIHIEMLDGKKFFFHNSDSDWKCFFHSAIYNLNRCFYCRDTFGVSADISAADPWLKEYIKDEKIGCTVVCVSDDHFVSYIEHMVNDGYLKLHKRLHLTEFVKSQYWTVAKKISYQRCGFLRFLITIFRTSFYRRIFLIGNYRYLHYKLYMKLLRKYRRKLYAKNDNY